MGIFRSFTKALASIHIAIRAYLIHYFRTRETAKVFAVAHAQELHNSPFHEWPLVRARQTAEMAAIKAGKLDASSIVDRKSWAWPFLPASVNRLSVPIAKATPYNIRRLSRTPVPRRAINLIKNAIIAQSWDIVSVADAKVDDEDDQKARIKIAKDTFRHPNNQDSFQTFTEMEIEDLCCYGATAVEMGLTLDPDRPLKLWCINVESIRIFASWTESTPDMPHYAQMTGLKGERGAVLFYDDEVVYMKDNPSTDNPFGVGKMEVAFASVNDFLGVQGMAGRAGTDQIHKCFLWWEQPQADSSYQIVRRHIQNELEGQAKVSIIGGMKKPDVLDITPVTEQDLLLNWQELLIRMIANAFDMSAMALGVEHDINRAVGQVLDDKDFRSAVVPMATRLQEAYTRKILHGSLGWYDLQFQFLNMDDPDKQTMIEMMTRMYSANSVTPNQIRNKMGMEKLDSPFADLTQFECMMINMEAMARVQDQSAEKQQQRQQKAQDAQMQQQQDNMDRMGGPMPGQGGGQNQLPPGSPLKTTPANMAKGGQMPPPKPMKLPQFPISGSRYNSRQIAHMPVNQLSDLINSGELPQPPQLLKDMDNQDPSILEEMEDDVRQFFEDALQEEQKKKAPKRNPQALKKWSEEQAKKFKARQKRTDDMSSYLYEIGRLQKKLQRGNTTQGLLKPGGKPGNLNPIQRV